jgi:hypothetical protein
MRTVGIEHSATGESDSSGPGKQIQSLSDVCGTVIGASEGHASTLHQAAW